MKMWTDTAGGRRVFRRFFALGMALSVITLAFAACGRPTADTNA